MNLVLLFILNIFLFSYHNHVDTCLKVGRIHWRLQAAYKEWSNFHVYHSLFLKSQSFSPGGNNADTAGNDDDGAAHGSEPSTPTPTPAPALPASVGKHDIVTVI